MYRSVPLCSYSFLLISNKFSDRRLSYLSALEGWYGPWNLPQIHLYTYDLYGHVHDACSIHYLGKWEGIKLLKCPRGVVWALKSPSGHHLYTYDLYGHVHDACSIHYLGKWEGIGPWKFWLVGPESAWCNFTGPKKVSIPGPNPLPLALVMDVARIKSIMHVAI